MTIVNDQGKPSLDVLAHHGVKGMHWGVRRIDGGSIPSGVQKHLDKAETKFQTKRSAANARVAKERASGNVNGKHAGEAAKLNAQHKANQIELQKQGLAIYKKFPDSVKSAKLTDPATRQHSTSGEKIVVGLLSGAVGLHVYNRHHTNR